MKLLIAHNQKFAEHAAKLLGLRHCDWKFIWTVDQLRGLDRNTEIVFVNAPRYRPSPSEREKRLDMDSLCHVRNFAISTVTLK